MSRRGDLRALVQLLGDIPARVEIVRSASPMERPAKIVEVNREITTRAKPLPVADLALRIGDSQLRIVESFRATYRRLVITSTGLAGPRVRNVEVFPAAAPLYVATSATPKLNERRVTLNARTELDALYKARTDARVFVDALWALSDSFGTNGQPALDAIADYAAALRNPWIHARGGKNMLAELQQIIRQIPANVFAIAVDTNDMTRIAFATGGVSVAMDGNKPAIDANDRAIAATPGNLSAAAIRAKLDILPEQLS